ncbi:hypothetical protein BH10ACI4_BH10ACI4_04670 [soil metagenome]
MFEYLLRVKALHRLGMGRPFRAAFIAVFVGATIAGLIYAFVVFHAVSERSHSPHVHAHSSQ